MSRQSEFRYPEPMVLVFNAWLYASVTLGPGVETGEPQTSDNSEPQLPETLGQKLP